MAQINSSQGQQGRSGGQAQDRYSNGKTHEHEALWVSKTEIQGVKVLLFLEEQSTHSNECR